MPTKNKNCYLLLPYGTLSGTPHPFSAKEEVVDSLGEAERGEVSLERATGAVEEVALSCGYAHVPPNGSVAR